MSQLVNKRVVLGITGGIAAYKSPDVVRWLRKRGAEVRVVMTPSAKQFITPLTLQAVSGYPVHDDLLDARAEAAMGHIELARWADIVLIAPATANFIAAFVHGYANDLLTTLCLATTARIVIAPAMNQQMWKNPATQANLEKLPQRGVSVLGPASGPQACGEVGPGRMLEPLEIVEHLENMFEPQLMSGLKVLISAGPTLEPIDPVRFISNHSSGKMGYALATAALEAGAAVTLVSGPVNLPVPDRVNGLHVTTAAEMADVVMTEAPRHHIFIAAAAVSDYRVNNRQAQKIKKSSEPLSLALVPNPDIVAAVAKLQQRRPFVVGFAAETEHLLEYARMKLEKKNLDIIVANQVGLPDRGFNQDDNAVILMTRNEEPLSFPLSSKALLARKLIAHIAKHYEKYSVKDS